MSSVRPTLRCLRDDLSLPLPPIDHLLDEIDHPILNKAREQFGNPDIPHERIVSIDDQVLFKVKVQRWRGAVWTEPTLSWLVAAGRRESGSVDDFYAALAADGRTARARYNADHKPALTTDIHSVHLLPDADDRKRYPSSSSTETQRTRRAPSGVRSASNLGSGRRAQVQAVPTLRPVGVRLGSDSPRVRLLYSASRAKAPSPQHILSTRHMSCYLPQINYRKLIRSLPASYCAHSVRCCL